MTFSAFRKHQKPILISACVFTVVVFVFFPAFGDITDLIGGRGEGGSGELMGTFTVATTGQTRRVSVHEFERARSNLERLFQRRRVTDEDAWMHLIELADARGAGLQVSRQAILDQLNRMTGDRIRSPADYRQLVMEVLRFSSPKAFEAFMSEIILCDLWREVQAQAVEVVTADEIYETRWKADHELFDFEALVFADVEPESIPDPGDDVLRGHFDDLPEWQRERSFSSEARYDLVYGWLPFTALDELPAEVRADLAAPTDAEIQARFQSVGRLRFPEVDELDEETRELLRRELLVIAAAEQAHGAALAIQSVAAELGGQEEGGAVLGKDAFAAIMAEHGLRVMDPEGLIESSGLQALEGIGSVRLGLYLTRTAAGDLHYLPPFGSDEQVHVILVEAKEDARPLVFEEARDKVLTHWREGQTARAARGFREALQAAARSLPEVEELVAPILAQAHAAAEAEIGAAETELDAEAQQAIREEKLENAQFDVDARVAQYEHLVWEQVAAGVQAERRRFEKVPRSYMMRPDPEEDPLGLERFLKTSQMIFALGVDGVSGVLRHAGSKHSAVVRVTERNPPEKAVMLADAESLAEARRQLGFTRRIEFQTSLSPETVLEAHGLAVVERPDARRP